MSEARSHLFGTFFALAWLALLVFNVAAAALSPGGLGPDGAIVGGGLLVFVLVYIWFWTRVVYGEHIVRGAILAAGGMALINLCLIFAGGSSAAQNLGYDFIYVVVVLAYGLPWRAGVIASLLTAGLTAGITVLFQAGLDTTIGVTVLVLLIGLGMVGVRTMRSSIYELRNARDEMARLAVSEERLRFARDLHDLLGHSLSVIVLKSEVAGNLIERDPGAAAEAVHDIERVARDALRDVRDAVGGYRKTNLAVELAGAREMLESAGISVRWEETAGDLPPDAETVLAWAVREGATNVLRHSRARECMVKLDRRNGSAVLEMLDDGVGGEAPDDAALGNGLRGLGERVAAVGGDMVAAPAEGRGFRLAVRVPVAGGA
ncbi:MAG TPA: sensor histidine kinase [Candidatus Solibacter sp.]|jgi:two-component system sensor histidine kinase DesK|nr:sensor histidine kinase [Candidatus Solibacter sp.]